MIAQTPELLLLLKLVDECGKYSKQNQLFLVHSMTKETKFLGFMFPQVVQR